MNAALAGKRVMITRPGHQAQEFAAAVHARGAQAVLAPLIEIGPPDDPQRAHRAAASASAGEYDWIVFTSRNAVDAFFENLQKDAAALHGVKVAAIGTKTAAALHARGVDADVVPQSFAGEDLAAALLDQIAPGRRALIFRAQEARAVLPAALKAAGIAVDDVAAYKTSTTSAPDFAAKLAAADVITFTSASTVAAFVSNAGAGAAHALHAKTVACIGPVTAKAARDAGLRVDVVAQEYTVEGLLNALEDRFASTASVWPR